MGRGNCELGSCDGLCTDCSFDCGTCDCSACDCGPCNWDCGGCFFCGSFSPNGDATPPPCNVKNWLCFGCFLLVVIFVCSISPLMKAVNGGGKLVMNETLVMGGANESLAVGVVNGTM